MMLESTGRLDSINRKWPCGTRIYEYKLPEGASDLFNKLDETNQHLIERIFNTRSLCTVGTYKMNAGMRAIPVVYFIDVNETLTIRESTRQYLSDYASSCPEINENDILNVMAIFDDKGNLYKDMEHDQFDDTMHLITACELSNLVLTELSELSVVRWTLESVDPDEFSVHLNLEDTKEVCSILGLDASLDLIEDFHYVFMN